jgi:ApaG protein
MEKTIARTFQIKVKCQYVQSESSPEDNHYFFAYRISIKNLSEHPAQLMSRHWLITDGLGHVEEVEGPGVVGLQPKLNPGQEFEYESACPLRTSSGSMRGSYQMRDDSGTTFNIDIPEFFLIAPNALH